MSGRLAFLLVATGFAVVAGVAIGPVWVAPADVWRALAGDGDPVVRAIVLDVRAPRVALALLVGASLGISGAVLQGALRNALAEPYLLGVSGGAAAGAVLAVAVGVSAPSVISVAAFAGALLAVALVMGVARAAGWRADPRVLLMAGVVVGAFANAAIMVLLAGAPAETTRGALWWMMGSLGAAQWRDAARLALVLAVTGPALLHWARDLDALALGHDAAAALGVRPEQASRRLFLTASLLAAGTVAAAGLVGFVGLVVPHIARGLVGARHRAVLSVAAIAGGGLVVAADLAARTVRAPAELPLGAVTAIVGVPFFLSLLRRIR
ncbi:MAG TPA: iron ABC transporter permease [Gemmatimonadaceae bacterium]